MLLEVWGSATAASSYKDDKLLMLVVEGVCYRVKVQSENVEVAEIH